MSAFHPLRTFGVAAMLADMKHPHWLLIIPAPLLLMGGYWFLLDDRSGVLDWIVLVVAVGVGLVGIWSTPWGRKVQLAVTLPYVPVMGAALAALIVSLECSTGNCF